MSGEEPIVPPEYDVFTAGQYSDEPLDTVTEDEIDVEIRIGPQDAFVRQDGVLMPTTAARSYSTTELEIVLTNDERENHVRGFVWTDGNTSVKPDEGDPLDENTRPELITIDVDNELMEVRDGNPEITRLWTGVISNSARLEGGGFKIMSFWPGMSALQHETFNYNGGFPKRTDGGGQFGKTEVDEYDFSSVYRASSGIAERIAELVTEETPFKYQIGIDKDGVEVGERPQDGSSIVQGKETFILVDTADPVPLTHEDGGLLEKVIRATNSVWEIDRYGDFYIGAPQPKSHKLRYITDTDAGKRSPAYRSVRVVGDGVVSQDGWNNASIVNIDREGIAVGDNVTTGGPLGKDLAEEKLAEPTYVYKNLEIATVEEANEVMEKLREEIREQMAGGEITVVGHPEVWPGHAVEMPDARRQPFNRERFLVKKVVHRINNDDGFITKITAGGMTHAADTSFSDETGFENQREYTDNSYEEYKFYKKLVYGNDDTDERPRQDVNTRSDFWPGRSDDRWPDESDESDDDDDEIGTVR